MNSPPSVPLHMPQRVVNQRTRPGCWKCSKWLHLCSVCTEKLFFKESKEKLRFLREFKPDPLSESCRGDVILVGADLKIINAHRSILAGRSSVFEEVFAVHSEMEEKETGVVKVADISSPALRSMVKYCYTAEICFSKDAPAEEVIKAAHQYEIAALKKTCEEILLLEDFTNENVLGRLELAYQYKLGALRKVGTRFIKTNIDKFLIFLVRGSKVPASDIHEVEVGEYEWDEEPEAEAGEYEWDDEREAEYGEYEWDEEPEAEAGEYEWDEEPEAEAGEYEWDEEPETEAGNMNGMMNRPRKLRPVNMNGMMNRNLKRGNMNGMINRNLKRDHLNGIMIRKLKGASTNGMMNRKLNRGNMNGMINRKLNRENFNGIMIGKLKRANMNGMMNRNLKRVNMSGMMNRKNIEWHDERKAEAGEYEWDYELEWDDEPEHEDYWDWDWD